MEDIVLETKGQGLGPEEIEKARSLVQEIGSGNKDGALLIFEKGKGQVAGLVYAHNMSKILVMQTVMRTFSITASDMAVLEKLKD